MMRSSPPSIPFLVSLFVASITVPANLLAAPPTEAQGIEFYEKKIRPVFVKHCNKCHSAEAESKNKLRGGLLLDSREAMLGGGDTGPALVPGKPAKSLLLETLNYDGDITMPPSGKLPDAVLADVARWIEMGAPAPAATGATSGRQIGMSVEEGRKFWSYQLPQPAPIPKVAAQDWPFTPIDQFILAKLEAKGLKPAAEADRATLAWRIYHDLTGLPPTPEEVDAFVRDPDPNAYEHLVDELLASPRFGEHWGRHWLDIARYGESVTLRGLIFQEAWRYRDYVIDSVNRDVPFNQFIREQIAGDLLPAETLDERRRLLTATTYLMLGNTNLEEQDKTMLRMDVVDEQLDVITKGILAQTVTCARCHDHKFDPIPTRDYYALAGILRNAKSMEHANVSKWLEVPMPCDADTEAEIARHEQQVTSLQAQIKTMKSKGSAKALTSTKGVLPLTKVPGVVVDDVAAKFVGEWQTSIHSGSYIGTGYIHDMNSGKGEKSIRFEPTIPKSGEYEVRLAYSSGGSRSDAVPVTIVSATGEKTIPVNMKLTPPIDGRFLSLGRYRFEKSGRHAVTISNQGTKGHVTADAVTFIPVETLAKLKPSTKPASETETTAQELSKLETELKKLIATGPKREMVMSVTEEKVIEDAHIHIRGNPHSLGAVAPRGFLQVAMYGNPPLPTKQQSGRVELANWLAADNNPLTARVYVNRAWHWLFGSGLVRTTDNFGTTGELPSHPQLLDALAIRFMKNGWSVKNLVREIVRSRTYRQSSHADAKTIAADPENQLFGRMNRRRIPAESIRDTILSISGDLKLDGGGRTFPSSLSTDYSYNATEPIRSVYLPMFRNSVPDLLAAFDCADLNLVTGRRSTSTVAPQALLMLNHPFVIEQSKRAADKLLAMDLDPSSRLTRLYRLVLGREPTAGERSVSEKFLTHHSGEPKAAWSSLIQALFASADFRYVN